VREVLLGDERVRVLESGEPGSYPIVLLHGWGAWAYNFRGILGPLAQAGYRAIAPDLRGHGGSSVQLPRGAWKREAILEWLRTLLNALGVSKCLLVGQSLGGAIALDAAAAMPNRVAAVVLLAPVGFTPFRRVMLARAFPWVSFPTTPRWIVASILRDVYGIRGQWTDRDLDEYWLPLRRGEAVEALLQCAREFDFTLRSTVNLDRCRVVIRFGELDRVIPLAAALRHAKRFSGADVAVLAGVGHVPADEIPGDMAELIRRVAEEVS
jgi:pimeloyl-ACP methyl ester carboxylesterase